MSFRFLLVNGVLCRTETADGSFCPADLFTSPIGSSPASLPTTSQLLTGINGEEAAVPVVGRRCGRPRKREVNPPVLMPQSVVSSAKIAEVATALAVDSDSIIQNTFGVESRVLLVDCCRRVYLDGLDNAPMVPHFPPRENNDSESTSSSLAAKNVKKFRKGKWEKIQPEGVLECLCDARSLLPDCVGTLCEDGPDSVAIPRAPVSQLELRRYISHIFPAYPDKGVELMQARCGSSMDVLRAVVAFRKWCRNSWCLYLPMLPPPDVNGEVQYSLVCERAQRKRLREDVDAETTDEAVLKCIRIGRFAVLAPKAHELKYDSKRNRQGANGTNHTEVPRALLALLEPYYVSCNAHRDRMEGDAADVTKGNSNVYEQYRSAHQPDTAPTVTSSTKRYRDFLKFYEHLGVVCHRAVVATTNPAPDDEVRPSSGVTRQSGRSRHGDKSHERADFIGATFSLDPSRFIPISASHLIELSRQRGLPEVDAAYHYLTLHHKAQLDRLLKELQRPSVAISDKVNMVSQDFSISRDEQPLGTYSEGRSMSAFTVRSTQSELCGPQNETPLQPFVDPYDADEQLGLESKYFQIAREHHNDHVLSVHPGNRIHGFVMDAWVRLVMDLAKERSGGECSFHSLSYLAPSWYSQKIQEKLTPGQGPLLAAAALLPAGSILRSNGVWIPLNVGGEHWVAAVFCSGRHLNKKGEVRFSPSVTVFDSLMSQMSAPYREQVFSVVDTFQELLKACLRSTEAEGESAEASLLLKKNWVIKIGQEECLPSGRNDCGLLALRTITSMVLGIPKGIIQTCVSRKAVEYVLFAVPAASQKQRLELVLQQGTVNIE